MLRSAAVVGSPSPGRRWVMVEMDTVHKVAPFRHWLRPSSVCLSSLDSISGWTRCSTAGWMLAEKLRRQRLYSNVIREQNKKTSEIPLPPLPKDPEDTDKGLPRRKALEYAKSIAKPQPKPEPKRQQDQSEGFPGLLDGAAHLEGLDLAQLAALDGMRRRHEEEKRAVASFRKAHVI
ncbi:hypothetical protein CRUP_026017 [Coryphaenoides rupestris]|nr:hypothetical protein CRUP_026017 [Coryphaenoides rupestris]